MTFWIAFYSAYALWLLVLGRRHGKLRTRVDDLEEQNTLLKVTILKQHEALKQQNKVIRQGRFVVEVNVADFSNN